jgi:DNA-binding transcriptional LysR family regulator
LQRLVKRVLQFTKSIEYCRSFDRSGSRGQGSLDFALAASFEGVSDASIEYTEVLTVPLAFAVHKSGKLANAISLEDLCEAKWIHSDTTNAYPQFIATLFGQHGLPVPRRITRCTSQSLLYSLAISLDPVMAWASHTLELANANGPFQKLDFIETSHSARLQLMRREGAILTRPAEYFICCIVEASEIFAHPVV